MHTLYWEIPYIGRWREYYIASLMVASVPASHVAFGLIDVRSLTQFGEHHDSNSGEYIF